MGKTFEISLSEEPDEAATLTVRAFIGNYDSEQGTYLEIYNKEGYLKNIYLTREQVAELVKTLLEFLVEAEESS